MPSKIKFDPDLFYNSLTLRQIRYFVATAEFGKVSLAASMVAISPSAVTDAISELEAGCGAKLFDRHPRGLSLTFEGHRFLAHCRNVLSAVKDASNTFSEQHNEAAGTFTLATSSTVVGYFIAPLLVRFQRTYPNVETKLIEGNRAQIIQGLRLGDYDLAIVVASNFPPDIEIRRQILMKSVRRLWVAPNHPFLKRSAITLEDVANEPYIQLTIDGTEDSTSRYWAARKLMPNIVFRSESVEAVRGLIAFGHGVTILSDMMYRRWSLEGDKVEVCDVADDIPTLDVGLMWKGERISNAAAATFQNFCRVEGVKAT